MSIDELILKFTQKGERPRVVNTILRENEKVGRPTRPDLRLTVKPQLCKKKKKEKRPQLSRCRVAEEQTHRSMKVKENAKTSPYKYIQLISDKGAKAALCKEDGLIKIWCWNNRESI